MNRRTLFGGKVATEIEQAYVRLAMFTMAAIYFIWVDNKYIQIDNDLLVYIFLCVLYFVGFLTLFIVYKIPNYRRISRKFHFVFDGAIVVIAFLILGEYASPFFLPICL